MATYVTQLDSQGNVVIEKLRILPNTPVPTDGGTWVPYTQSNEAIVTERVIEIKKIRDTKLSQGGYRVGSKWFHADPFSRIQHLGLVSAGNNLPGNIDWKTMDGTFIRMTPLLAQQIFAAAMYQDNAMFTHAEMLISQVKQAEDPYAVDITVGWPETFNGV